MILFYPFILTMASAHVLTPSYQEGKECAGEGQEQVSQEMKSRDVKDFLQEVQGQGRNPAKGDLGSPLDSSVSSFLLDVYGDRQHFELNPQKDPLFQTPETALSRVDGTVSIQTPSTYTKHTCTETKIKPVVECHVYAHPYRVPYTVSVQRKGELSTHSKTSFFSPLKRMQTHTSRVHRYWRRDHDKIIQFITAHTSLTPEDILSYNVDAYFQNGSHATTFGGNTTQARSFQWGFLWNELKPTYRVQYTYSAQEEHARVHVEIDNRCQAFEELSRQGIYRQYSSICLDNQNPRRIETLPVHHDCWDEKRIYHATRSTLGECKALRDRGCEQVSSKFHKGVYHQTYRCIHAITKSISSPGNRPFCLMGSCEEINDLDDTDFDQALAQMALVNELGKYAGQPHIFSGQPHSCKNTKFKHCCFKSSGIAVRTGISKCSSGERELSRKRGKGLCVYVGSKTIKKARIKIGKKKVYCCFPSKLLRVFQEQGRSQLGLGWGRAKHPHCRGLTLDEIQRIDFERMDLSEAFDDIKTQLTQINVPKAQRQLKQRLQDMQGVMK